MFDKNQKKAYNLAMEAIVMTVYGNRQSNLPEQYAMMDESQHIIDGTLTRTRFECEEKHSAPGRRVVRVELLI